MAHPSIKLTLHQNGFVKAKQTLSNFLGGFCSKLRKKKHTHREIQWVSERWVETLGVQKMD